MPVLEQSQGQDAAVSSGVLLKKSAFVKNRLSSSGLTTTLWLWNLFNYINTRLSALNTTFGSWPFPTSRLFLS